MEMIVESCGYFQELLLNWFTWHTTWRLNKLLIIVWLRFKDILFTSFSHIYFLKGIYFLWKRQIYHKGQMKVQSTTNTIKKISRSLNHPNTTTAIRLSWWHIVVAAHLVESSWMTTVKSSSMCPWGSAPQSRSRQRQTLNQSEAPDIRSHRHKRTTRISILAILKKRRESTIDIHCLHPSAQI